jgi:predicted alpha/beta superfamily hydrolase
MMRKQELFISLCFVIVLNIFGQEPELNFESYTLPRTEVRYLSSDYNIEYKLYVSLPHSYPDSANKNYPVLYLLDADYSFAIAKNITDHLSERNHLQELILVGIAYAGPNKYRLHRTRDYTPTKSSERVWFKEIQEKYSGGAPAFANFIESKLFPFMESNFSANENRTLTGHSYGGLFTSWVMLTKPNMFNGYIVVSPSLWYDDHLLFKVDEKLSEKRTHEIKAYFAVGDRESNNQWNMPKDLEDFVNYLKSKKIPKFLLKYNLGNDETHNSVFPWAISSGIRFVLEGI